MGLILGESRAIGRGWGWFRGGLQGALQKRPAQATAKESEEEKEEGALQGRNRMDRPQVAHWLQCLWLEVSGMWCVCGYKSWGFLTALCWSLISWTILACGPKPRSSHRICRSFKVHSPRYNCCPILWLYGPHDGTRASLSLRHRLTCSCTICRLSDKRHFLHAHARPQPQVWCGAKRCIWQRG